MSKLEGKGSTGNQSSSSSGIFSRTTRLLFTRKQRGSTPDPQQGSNKKQRGSTPEVLRGSIGADFENHGRVGGMDCGCFGVGERNRERLILVKGLFCFVFVNENAPSPKYAIALKDIQARVEHPSSSGHVLLETIMGDVEYELSFASEETARQFAEVVRRQHSVAAEDSIRQRMGHDHLLTKSSSVLCAEAVAHQTLEKLLSE